MKKKLEEKFLVFGIVLCFLSISSFVTLPSLSGILALLTIICFTSVKREYGIALWAASIVTLALSVFVTSPPIRITSFYALVATCLFFFYLIQDEYFQAFAITFSFSVTILNFVFSLFSLHYIGGAIGAIIGFIGWAILLYNF